MKHSFGIDVRKCSRCEAPMRFVAVLLDREEGRQLLEHLRLWSEPPKVLRARRPPDEHETFEFT